MKNEIFLSVIIPCYNEEANLKRGVLREIKAYLDRQSYGWEVVISDDGSNDRSKVLVGDFISKISGFRLIKNLHGGKPFALLHGIKNARGKYILFTDMDQSTPISELDKLMLEVKSGYKVVIGSRGVVRRNFPLYRKLGAIIFMLIRRFLILPEIKDTQCGFKLFERKLVRSAFPKLEYFKNARDRSGWKVSSYDVELLHIIKKLGVAIKEVVVKWNDRDVSTGKGGAIQKYIRESKEMFTQILRVKINDLKGIYP